MLIPDMFYEETTLETFRGREQLFYDGNLYNIHQAWHAGIVAPPGIAAQYQRLKRRAFQPEAGPVAHAIAEPGALALGILVRCRRREADCLVG